jgi:hypothetical protein
MFAESAFRAMDVDLSQPAVDVVRISEQLPRMAAAQEAFTAAITA